MSPFRPSPRLLVLALLLGTVAAFTGAAPARAQQTDSTATDTTQAAAADTTQADAAQGGGQEGGKAKGADADRVDYAPGLPYDRVTWGMYGRMGVDLSFNREGAIGRTLSLTGLGSIGGRLEEGDYIELVPTWRLKAPEEDGDLAVDIHARLVMFSKRGQLLSFISSGLVDDLAVAVGGFYVQAENLWRPGVNVWVGARYYRGPDIHIADYYYFNDLYGQGVGVEIDDTQASILFVAPVDTAGVPPYVFNNVIQGGVEVPVRRQRMIFSAQHKLRFGREGQFLHALGQFHHLPEASQSGPDTTVFPTDWGYVVGLRHHTPLPALGETAYNDLAVRYGGRIANGSDGGNAFTWLTYGAPEPGDPDERTYAGAYQLQIVDNFLVNVSPRFDLGGYGLYRPAKGGADSDGQAPNFEGDPIFNRKWDAAAGLRGIYYLSDTIHLMGEAHYTVRKNGEMPAAQVGKLSFAPLIMPLGERGFFARPHLRLVYSIAFYDQDAQDQLLSPYLQSQGRHDVAHYLGVKSEWWF